MAVLGRRVSLAWLDACSYSCWAPEHLQNTEARKCGFRKRQRAHPQAAAVHR